MVDAGDCTPPPSTTVPSPSPITSPSLDTQLEMLVNNVTVENYEAVVSELSSIAEQSVGAVEQQTEENLGRIATAFNSVASLVANSSALTIMNNVSV